MKCLGYFYFLFQLYHIIFFNYKVSCKEAPESPAHGKIIDKGYEVHVKCDLGYFLLNGKTESMIYCVDGEWIVPDCLSKLINIRLCYVIL